MLCSKSYAFRITISMMFLRSSGSVFASQFTTTVFLVRPKKQKAIKKIFKVFFGIKHYLKRAPSLDLFRVHCAPSPSLISGLWKSRVKINLKELLATLRKLELLFQQDDLLPRASTATDRAPSSLREGISNFYYTIDTYSMIKGPIALNLDP